MTPLARLLAIAAITLGATGLVLFIGGRPMTVTVTLANATPTAVGGIVPLPPVESATDSPAASLEAVEANIPASPPLELSRTVPAWETQLDAIASDPSKNDAARASAVFAMLPALPEEALSAAVERAIERLPDADYASVALPVITNPRMHGRVMSVLFSDLMERPDAITLPALLRIARNADHPFAPSARDNLRLLLDVDLGTDWTRWEAEIQRRLENVGR